MSFSLYIARRYTISRSKSSAVNIITAIAALGIIASTAALFIIMSAFSGLREFTVSFTNATDPELRVAPALGKSFTISAQQEQELKKTAGITHYTKIAEERVLFYYDGKEQVAYLKGVDSIYTDVNPIKEKVIQGNWLQPETSQVVIGYGIMSKLSMGLFDFNNALEVYVPKPGKGLIKSPEDGFKKATLIPIGIYSVNDDVDSKYVFADLGLTQELLQFKPEQITAIELKLTPGANEETVREKLNTIFKGKIAIKNRIQLNASLYKMLNAENLVTYLFCSLVVVMTLFCLAGALIMLILDKRENIKTLYSLGTTVTELRNIFLYQGIFITTLGVLIGLAISVSVVLAQQHYSLIMLTDTLAYPVQFTFVNILIVIATIYTLGILASWLAANRVNNKLLENS
ncbi:ABC transporter permease [Flavobacterium salilacus subsp. salilacus]|uniref:ABC transporter permease n=1 Tax=Flavobacterium TaxID=237 RepID=UPI001075157F|nr:MULTISPECIES: ABC transporter permease [Flavobacterium]KAF2518363.1 ABC transporter permease [Flavobacterium salilacus subsp. salilacus]MBE1615221.1 ABC transporter permease [Flavobacterium sp. SaA2.13]